MPSGSVIAKVKKRVIDTGRIFDICVQGAHRSDKIIFVIPEETLYPVRDGVETEVPLHGCYFYLLYKRNGDTTTQIPKYLSEKSYDETTHMISVEFVPDATFTANEGSVQIQLFACDTQEDFTDTTVDIDEVPVWTTVNTSIMISKSQFKDKQVIVDENMFVKGIAEMSAYLKSAEGAASDAEEFAKGTRSDGLTVPHASTGANDNAKDYKDLAKDWAMKDGSSTVDGTYYSARKYALNAEDQKNQAKNWAISDGKPDGTHLSSKGYAVAAGESATSAATSADIVSAHATQIDAIGNDLAGDNTIGTVAADLTGDDDIGTVAGSITDVNTVASDLNGDDTIGTVASDLSGSDTIGTVATDLAGSNNIGTVAGISGNVTTVAGIYDKVTTVAGINGDVTTVAGIDDEVVVVAGINDKVTAVAAIDDEITTVADSDNLADIGTVATNIGDINDVADDILNINAVAGDLSNIDNASTYASNAAASAALAADWAEKETAVETGKYSAKYWAEQASTVVTGKEDASNKVTSISGSSTDTQYPSAKCVYINVSNLKDAITDTEQRVQNIEVALSGTVVQTNTDSTQANVKSITSADTILQWAILKRVGARSTQFNQLVDSGTSSLTLTSGHKYVTVINGTATKVDGTGQSVSVTGGSDNVHDLTIMGLDSLTADQFKALFPSSYYTYKAGTIVDINTTGFDVVGKNKWDEEYEEGYYNLSTGAKTGSSMTWRSKNLTKVDPNTEYKISLGVYLLYYDFNGSFISSDSTGNKVFTTPPNCFYIAFYQDKSGWSNEILVCLNSVTDKTYAPYHKTTIDTSFMSGKKYVNSSCYDYAENVYVDGVLKRKDHSIVDSTSLASLTWTESGGVYYATVSGMKSDGAVLCDKYDVTVSGTTISITTSSSPTGTLYFEKSTQTETTVDTPIPNFHCENGTTITTVTPQTTVVNAIDVPSTIAYQTKISS